MSWQFFDRVPQYKLPHRKLTCGRFRFFGSWLLIADWHFILLFRSNFWQKKLNSKPLCTVGKMNSLLPKLMAWENQRANF
jgi:hypothetical protein